jgi:hypothetical protein
MSETSRRAFLVVAGAGAASAVAATAGTASAGQTRRKVDSAQLPVVAYVRDHRSSELQLMVGERAITVHDPDLVIRILNAAGGE